MNRRFFWITVVSSLVLVVFMGRWMRAQTAPHIKFRGSFAISSEVDLTNALASLCAQGDTSCTQQARICEAEDGTKCINLAEGSTALVYSFVVTRRGQTTVYPVVTFTPTLSPATLATK